ncbi:MAG: HemK/PrmC family methyltransferase [Desulfobacterales bacterium]|jgi:release factor glutamine methyltransferase
MQKQNRLRPPEWTIIKLVQWATTYFSSHDIDSPRATAEILLAHVLNTRRIDLYLRYDQPLIPVELERFKALIKRRLNREPVAYIVENKEFWSMDLHVTRDVLIPRPETECLVEKALEWLAADSKPESTTTPKAGGLGFAATGGGRQGREVPQSLRAEPGARHPVWKTQSKLILELGTGSGAVILALASENPRHSYWATDISVYAIRVARRNARRYHLGGKVHFIAGDWFAPLRSKPGLFDLIVSNPPYIKSDDLTRLQPEIHAYEPLLALDGAEDGLHCLRHIIQSGYLFLKPRGVIILEIGNDQKEPLKQMIAECGEYEEVNFYQDYSGHDRILQMKKKA